MAEEIQFWESAGNIRLAALGRQTARRVWNWHSHDFYELALVLSGACDWRLGPPSGPRTRRTVAAGEAFLLRPGAWHGEQVAEGRTARVAWVGFASAAPPPAWTGRPFPLGDDGAEVAQAFHAIYREHGRPENGARVRLALRSLLLLASRQAEKPSAAARPAGRGPGPHRRADDPLNPSQTGRIEAAAHTLRHNRLPISQAAALHSFSPAHFSTLFRRHFRVTPRAFVRRARLERAEDLLATSAMTVKEIAAEAGFADSAHFCKAFRSFRGTTPRAFRQAEGRAHPLL